MPLNVVVAFALAPELIRQIEAVSPDVRVWTQAWSADELAEAPRRWGSQLQARADMAQLRPALAEAEVIFCMWAALAQRLGDVRAAAPKLRWVQSTAAGADEITPDLVKSGITFTLASGVASTTIAEFALTLMLMFQKGWPAFFRQQQRHDFSRTVPGELAGKTVGIVGVGHIGAEVARLTRDLGCRVLGMRRSVVADDPLLDEAVPPGKLDYLLQESDYVVLAAPLTPETRGLIGEAQLRAMKSSAYLINVARGPLVDEAALVHALLEGWIAGAGLDVFAQEPLPPESPLWDLDNVIMSPHASAGTEAYYERATAVFIDNLRRFIAGQPLRYVVDPERGY